MLCYHCAERNDNCNNSTIQRFRTTSSTTQPSERLVLLLLPPLRQQQQLTLGTYQYRVISRAELCARARGCVRPRMSLFVAAVDR